MGGKVKVKVKVNAFFKRARPWAFSTVLASLFIAQNVQAAEEAFARVLVDSVELRSEPTISSRVIGTASRGETLAIEERKAFGDWLRVTLADGRTAYLVGGTVEVYLVNPETSDLQRPGFFAPPPLQGSRGGLAIVGGVLRTPALSVSNKTELAGYFEVRPSIVFHETVSIDGFVGAGLTGDGAQLLYGASATLYVAPKWAVCPFLSLGGGGLSVFPNSDTFVLKREDAYVARAGGGVLLALRNRILVRLEASNLSLFTPSSFRNAQTFAGGLGVYF
jgi:Bacterial SH3 domain